MEAERRRARKRKDDLTGHLAVCAPVHDLHLGRVETIRVVTFFGIGHR